MTGAGGGTGHARRGREPERREKVETSTPPDADPRLDELLDEALMETFPASDPPAVGHVE